MVTISHLTKKYVKDSFMLRDYLEEGLINYAALAERLKPRIEKELGRNVKTSAVMMAIRRYTDKIKNVNSVSFKNIEIALKTGLCDISIAKSASAYNTLNEIHAIVNLNAGDTLQLMQGNYEISIIFNQKYKNNFLAKLKKEKILHIEDNLVSLTVNFGKEHFYTPGVTSHFLRALALESINLVEIVSSAFETNFIISEKDAVRGYQIFKEIVE